MAWLNGQWTGGKPALADFFGEGDASACYCCGSAGVPLKVYERERASRPYKECERQDQPPFQPLCRLCAGTMTGTWNSWAEQHDHDALTILRTICFVGNEILKRLPAPPGDKD